MGASGAVDGGDGGEGAHFSRWALCTVHLSRQTVISRGTQGGSTSTAFIACRANAAARALKNCQILMNAYILLKHNLLLHSPKANLLTFFSPLILMILVSTYRGTVISCSAAGG